MSDWITVADADQMGPGAKQIVDVDDVMVAVFNIDGDYYAIEDVCTHDGAPLDLAKIEGTQIICPRHGARFCIKTGAALTAPAYEPIPTFPVKVEDGTVYVRDDRWD